MDRAVSGDTPSMMIAPDDPRLLPIALRMQLIAQGLDDRYLARAVRTGVLARPRRGAYVDGPAWQALGPEERYAVRARAVARQAKTDVVLSHVSALPFHRAPLSGHELSDIHVTRMDGRTGRAERHVRQHRGRLLDEDVHDVHGVRVMSPLRTVLECAAVSTTEATLVAANHLLHAGVITKPGLEARSNDQMDHWPGTLSARIVIALADPRIASAGESRTSYFFYSQSLPRPVPQHRVEGADGFLAFLDFALPEHGVWFEFDGMGKYVDHLRPGETVAEAVLREKRREDRIREITGWRCMRITWADLADPVRLAARVRAFIRGTGAGAQAS